MKRAGRGDLEMLSDQKMAPHRVGERGKTASDRRGVPGADAQVAAVVEVPAVAGMALNPRELRPPQRELPRASQRIVRVHVPAEEHDRARLVVHRPQKVRTRRVRNPRHADGS